MSSRQPACFSFRRVCALLGAVVAGCASAQTTILREGEGSRRTELNSLELQAFPDDLLGKLSDWQNGAALTPADYAGKPVLIFTWSDWYAPAKRSMATARKMSEKYSKDGLIVVGVHNPEGWADSVKPPAAADTAFLLAHDASGDFRKALKVDQDPDFYLIDRAGQLRYADIRNESLEAAVAELVGEKSEDAGTVKGRLANDAKARDAAARRTAALHGGALFTQMPEQEFTVPGPEAYKEVKWPEIPKDPNNPTGFSNSSAAAKIVVLPQSDWFPSKPETKGRMIVLYFWSPIFTETYYSVMPFADQMQTQFGRDAVVIGVMSQFDNINGVALKDEDKDTQKLLKRMKGIAESRDLKHYIVADPGNVLLSSLQQATGEQFFPFWAIVSSDNTARWWSATAASSPWGAMQKIIENDPGIKARRAAEAGWLGKNK